MIKETSLVMRTETLSDKIRKNLLMFIYQKDFIMIQRFEELIQPKRPNTNEIIIPKEIGKNRIKYGQIEG